MRVYFLRKTRAQDVTRSILKTRIEMTRCCWKNSEDRDWFLREFKMAGTFWDHIFRRDLNQGCQLKRKKNKQKREERAQAISP